MPRLLIHFARFGPYHHARLKSAAKALLPLGWEVIGLETAGNDATYAWNMKRAGSASARVITAFPGRVHEEITASECKRVMHPMLDGFNPDAIAIAGWAGKDALSCLSWCRENDKERFVMSETREADGKRVWWKERIKRYLISRFNGALVGGKSQRDYLVKLGMSEEKIRFGYNVVDNAYFAVEAERWRRLGVGDRGQEAGGVRESEVGGCWSDQLGTKNQELGTLPYFLASNRFIERKNLARLIDAYSLYVKRVSSPTTDNRQLTTAHWNLCLLGDGELKAELIAQCHALSLNVIESAPWDLSSSQSSIINQQSTIINPAIASSLTPDPCLLTPGLVFFPGFRQIEELPRFYAHAGCFVHPALEEPWGLVINEAMASGLPILSGTNVGAAEELVDEGVNGWCFDAKDVEQMALLMGRISAFDFPLSAFGDASRQLLEERCPTAAFGLGLAELLVE